MQFFNLRTAVAAFSAVVVLSACGGGDNNSGNGPITNPTVPLKSRVIGRAALGALTGATCTAFRADGTTRATTDGTAAAPAGTTNANGEFDLGAILSSDFPLIIKCLNGNFFDESTGMTAANTTSINAVVPQARTSASTSATPNLVAITLLTTAATEVFLAAPAATRNNSTAASANQQIVDALFPGGDILTAPTAVTTTTATLGTSLADQYAAILASLSYAVGQTPGATVSERTKNFVEGLALDAKDGTIDGKSGSTPIATVGYNTFTELVQDVKDGTQSYETANPNASGATNTVQASENKPRDPNTTPTTTGS